MKLFDIGIQTHLKTFELLTYNFAIRIIKKKKKIKNTLQTSLQEVMFGEGV